MLRLKHPLLTRYESLVEEAGLTPIIYTPELTAVLLMALDVIDDEEALNRDELPENPTGHLKTMLEMIETLKTTQDKNN